MATSASAIKQGRQSLKRQRRNHAVRAQLKSLVKKVQAALAAKKTDEARQLLKKAVSAFDQAVTKRVLHGNTASRRVSRLTVQVNKLLAPKKTA